MKKVLRLAASLGLLALSAPVSAEGSAELDVDDSGGDVSNDQALDDETVFFVDILDGDAERICWTGTGSLEVFRPDGTTAVATLAGSGATNRCTVTAPGVDGAYALALTTEQAVGTAWDVRVCTQGVTANACLTNAANEQLGRLWSYRWDFARTSTTGSSYAAANAVNGSVYAVVPGGAEDRDAVVEMQMEGVSGFWYELMANGDGPETTAGERVGRSVPKAGHQITPAFPIYLNPPAIADYDWITPEVSGVALAPACGETVVVGAAPGEVEFTSNVVGKYVLVCDADDDGVYDFAAANDFSTFGDAAVGVNTAEWDGTQNDGDPVAEGVYECIVRLHVGEFHYIADDIESSYQGFRMYRVNGDASRTPLPMFWDDTAVQLSETMPNGETSPPASPVDGLAPGAYGTAAAAFYLASGTPTGNARAWGDFTATSKGNDAFLDTFASADADVSAALPVQVIAGGGDFDGDGLANGRECALGSDPGDEDTDGDGVGDGFEATTSGASPDTDGDGTLDVLDTDDDGDGVPTADERADPNGDGDPGDAVDTDGTGAPNYLDADADDDGVPDGEDARPRDATQCRDADDDGCDDCAMTGADGSGGDPMADGADADGDGVCDASELPDDADGDGVPDAEDLDDDNDGIHDAAEGPGDADGDGTPNRLDLDSDGDGLLDILEGGGEALDADGDGRIDDFRDDAARFGGDGLDDRLQGPGNALPLPDTDGDGTEDFLDPVADGTGGTGGTGATGGTGGVGGGGTGAAGTSGGTGGVDEPLEPYGFAGGGCAAARTGSANGSAAAAGLLVLLIFAWSGRRRSRRCGR